MSNETTVSEKVATAATATYEARAYVAPDASSRLAPGTIQRRNPGPRDLRLEVLS